MPPFDPDQPADSSPLSSQVMRGQLTSLHDLIAALNAINAATVDGVATLNPGDPAQVLLSLIGNTLNFTFAIPQGFPGADGGPGPQGPPFATAVIDAVNTLPAGSAATVSVSYDGTYVHFTFGIPEGQPGGQGAQGVQGPPGEVTSSELSSAISGTSNTTNGVSTLSQTADTSYNQAQMQQLLDKVDEFLLAARR